VYSNHTSEYSLSHCVLIVNHSRTQAFIEIHPFGESANCLFGLSESRYALVRRSSRVSSRQYALQDLPVKPQRIYSPRQSTQAKMISLSNAALVAIIGTLVYKTTLWIRNIRLAQATGLPWTWTPILETEFVGFCLTPLLRAIYHGYLDKGKGWPRWCRFIIKDWQWEDKRRAHDEYGDVFLCVAPHGIICYCADAAMAWDVMNRRYDFTKPMDKYSKFWLYDMR
jgi:hypothetical protein